jgi:hypothetical protein
MKGMSHTRGLCRSERASASGYDSPLGRHGLANRLRTTGFPTPNLSTLRWGRCGGWRSAGNREALPMPRCDPLQNLATSATPARERQDRLIGSGPTGRSHRDGDALSKKWSVERPVTRPTRLATVGRYASCCCPGSFDRGSPRKCPRLSRTSLRRHGGSRGSPRSTRRALERRSLRESSFRRRPISLLAFRERRSDTDPVRAGQRPYGPWSSRPVSPPSHDALLAERLPDRSSRSTVGLLGQRPPVGGHTPVTAGPKSPHPGGMVGSVGRPACAGSPLRGPVRRVRHHCHAPGSADSSRWRGASRSGVRPGRSGDALPRKGVSRDRLAHPEGPQAHGLDPCPFVLMRDCRAQSLGLAGWRCRRGSRGWVRTVMRSRRGARGPRSGCPAMRPGSTA